MIEFGIDVNPTRMVKGEGLAKLMAEENCELMGINFTCVSSAKLQTVVAIEVVQDQNDIQPVVENLSSCEWYSGIIHFLQNLEVPPGLVRFLSFKLALS